ncbi:hypothetical protein BHM03_00044588 [Ensete ventricosum]|nr:hypothetical protein BHM03_00044588 [Ensete ventricosum]
MPRTYPVGQAAREVLRGLPQTKKYSPFGLPSMLQQKSRGHRTAMAQASRDENSTYSKESGVGRSKGCREMAATQSIWRKPGGRRSSFYSGCCRSFVPDDLTAFMTYHATVPSTMLAVLAMRRAFAGGDDVALVVQRCRTQRQRHSSAPVHPQFPGTFPATSSTGHDLTDCAQLAACMPRPLRHRMTAAAVNHTSPCRPRRSTYCGLLLPTRGQHLCAKAAGRVASNRRRSVPLAVAEDTTPLWMLYTGDGGDGTVVLLLGDSFEGELEVSIDEPVHVHGFQFTV